MRHWAPSQTLIDTIQEGPNSEPSNDDIREVILSNPEATVLTVSRRASARINSVVVSAIFEQEEPLAVIQFDNDDDEPANVYKKNEGHNYSK